MSQPIETLSAAQQIVAQTGIGLPAALNNYVMRDSAAVRAELGLGTARTALGGTVSPFAGTIQLSNPVTASAFAMIYGYPAIMCNVSPTGMYNRRIVIGFSITNLGGPVRNITAQFGRDRNITTPGFMNSPDKGFGISMGSTTFNFYYQNGSVQTVSGAISNSLYGRYIMDFIPGVSITLYGVTAASGSLVQIYTSSASLPTGNDVTANGSMLEIAAWDSSASIGSATNTWVNNVSISFP